MKKILLFSVLYFVDVFAIAQKLDGAFIITGGQHGDKILSRADIEKQKIIKVFKNGYWICAYFGDPNQPFNGTCGGTYKTEKGKYIETIDYYSWDSTAVGKTYFYNYTLNKNSYVQDGKMQSEKYLNYIIREEFVKIHSNKPLKDTAMEGVWILQDATWIDSSGKENSINNYQQIKIYCHPRFAYAQYNIGTKQFVGAGGGTYEYDGNKLVEHIEYTTYDNAPGSDYEIKPVQLSYGLIQQISQQGSYKETWKRSKP